MSQSVSAELMPVIDAIEALSLVNDIPYLCLAEVGFGRVMELHAWCLVVQDRMSNYIRILTDKEDEKDD